MGWSSETKSSSRNGPWLPWRARRGYRLGSVDFLTRMKTKTKLTSLQQHRLRVAYREASEVLREIKLVELRGKALEDMKALESAVQQLEVCQLIFIT